MFLIASCILVDAPQIRSNSPLSILRFCCDSRMPVSFTDQPRPGTDISDRTRCPPFTVHRPPSTALALPAFSLAEALTLHPFPVTSPSPGRQIIVLLACSASLLGTLLPPSQIDHQVIQGPIPPRIFSFPLPSTTNPTVLFWFPWPRTAVRHAARHAIFPHLRSCCTHLTTPKQSSELMSHVRNKKKGLQEALTTSPSSFNSCIGSIASWSRLPAARSPPPMVQSARGNLLFT